MSMPPILIDDTLYRCLSFPPLWWLTVAIAYRAAARRFLPPANNGGA